MDSVMVLACMRPDLDFEPNTPRVGNNQGDDPSIRRAALTCSCAIGASGIRWIRLPLYRSAGTTRQPSCSSDFGASAQSSRRAPVSSSNRRQMRVVGIR